MERFSRSYAEISPSGLGIKIWGKGRLQVEASRSPSERGCYQLRAWLHPFAWRGIVSVPAYDADYGLATTRTRIETVS